MRIIAQERLREVITAELLSRGGRLKRDEILINCCFHNDRNPSLGVHIGFDLPPGSFHCWSCGESGAWGKLAAKLGIQGQQQTAKQASRIPDNLDVFRLMHQVIQRKNPLEVPVVRTLPGIEPLPRNFQWRGLGKRFLEEYGAKYWWQREIERDIEMEWLYFPLFMNREYKGYTICALRPHAPKYMVFADTSKTFFLYDHIPERGPVVLVEGHHDALRLQAEGIPAVGIFGTENWSAVKKEYLIAKMPSKVLVLFDGDRAGTQAAQKVFLDLREGTQVDIMYLPQGADKTNKLDPGNMPHEYIEEVHGRLALC